LRGIGAQKLGALFMFISFYIFGIPVALLFAFVFQWKVVGLWGGLTVGLCMVAILYFIKIVFFINWEKEVKLAKERVSKEEMEIMDPPHNQDDYSNELNEMEAKYEINQDNELENYKINTENVEINGSQNQDDEISELENTKINTDLEKDQQ
jgi:hypothetical protein